MLIRACGVLAVSAALSCAGVARAQGTAPADPPATKAKADYIEVPLTGEFGKEILAGGVRKALTRAKAERVQHVVFVLDSGGGYVEDAKAIAEVMKEFDPAFTYHAVIKKAFSASLWVLANCDHWYCAPGGATGAAVVYSLKSGTGSVEVDAKLNGAVAATLASTAEQKGHPGDAVRAMVLMDAKLYLNPATPGSKASRLSAVQQPGGQEIDSESTVLSASMAQMVEWGLATELPVSAGGPADAVGKAIGATAWKSSGNGGVGAMKASATAFAAAMAERDRGYKQYEDGMKSMAEAAKSFNTAKTAADSVEPNKIPLHTDQYGKISSESRKRYNAEVDAKVARLDEAGAAARGIATAQGNAKRAAAAYEAAHRRAAEAAGLDAARLRRESVEVPEVPKDVQAAVARAADDAVYWRKSRRN